MNLRRNKSGKYTICIKSGGKIFNGNSAKSQVKADFNLVLKIIFIWEFLWGANLFIWLCEMSSSRQAVKLLTSLFPPQTGREKNPKNLGRAALENNFKLVWLLKRSSCLSSKSLLKEKSLHLTAEVYSICIERHSLEWLENLFFPSGPLLGA